MMTHRLWRTAVPATLFGLGIVGLLGATPAIAEADRSVGCSHARAKGHHGSAATLVDIASSSESFETLTAALQAAGLVDILNGEEKFTVFAPTDEAFAALPEGALDALLLPENQDQLIQILTYHVVPGEVRAADLSTGAVATVEGQTVQVTVEDGVTVNSATVIQADIEASNGIIHVIDAVLLPPQ